MSSARCEGLRLDFPDQLAAAAMVPDHHEVRGGCERRWRATTVISVLAATLLHTRVAKAGPGFLPHESPLYGEPYRRGLALEVSVGVALCQPALLYAGTCAPRGAAGPSPGVALRLGGGWRFNENWQLSGAWIRQGHRPGGSFSSGMSDGGMLAIRGIVPLPHPHTGATTRYEFGFELGLGWSQRVLSRDAAPNRLSSNGAVLRPALIFDGWGLADLALGIEIATQLNLHWQHCVDDLCETAPGPWVPNELERRWVNGFSIAVRATGLVFPRF